MADEDVPLTPEELMLSIRRDYVVEPIEIRECDLLAITSLLVKCPEWWDYPCMCAECRSYADEFYERES